MEDVACDLQRVGPLFPNGRGQLPEEVRFLVGPVVVVEPVA